MFIGSLIAGHSILSKEYESFDAAWLGLSAMQRQYPNTNCVFAVSKKELSPDAAVEIMLSQVE